MVDTERPLVSIILPVYNDEKSVRSSLMSLLCQAYPNIEVITINDGSTDATENILLEVARSNGLVRVLNRAHSGPTVTRNIGYRAAKGSVIFFAESDAIYNPDYVTKAVACLQSDSSIDCVCVTGGPLKLISNLVTECIDIENKVQHRLLRDGQIEPFYAWVYRREVLETIGGFDEGLSQGEDRDLFQRAREAGFKVGLVPGVNWRHIRDETVLCFAAKCYKRGVWRTLFLLKYRAWTRFFKSVALLWMLPVGILLSPVSPLPVYLTLTVFALALAYRTVGVVRNVYYDVEKKKYLLLYPIFLTLRHLSFALGYTRGLARVAVNRLKGQVSTS